MISIWSFSSECDLLFYNFFFIVQYYFIVICLNVRFLYHFEVSFNMKTFIFYFKLWKSTSSNIFSPLLLLSWDLLSRSCHYISFSWPFLTFIIPLSFLPSGNVLNPIFQFTNSFHSFIHSVIYLTRVLYFNLHFSYLIFLLDYFMFCYYFILLVFSFHCVF